MAEEVGADRKVTWQHGLQVWIGVDATPVAARRHVSVAMEGFYNPASNPSSVTRRWATPNTSPSSWRPYVDAGATTLNLTPCGPDRTTEIETVAEVKRLLQR